MTLQERITLCHGASMRIALAILLAFAVPAQAADRDTLTTTTLRDFPFSLEAERGKVVLVNFWATWCAPCRAEMPALDAYYRAHHAAGLEMIAVSLDLGASKAKLAKFTQGYAFPVARIADTRLARSAIPSALPVTRIYARDGTLRYDSARARVTMLDAAAIERIVAPLLAEEAGR